MFTKTSYLQNQILPQLKRSDTFQRYLHTTSWDFLISRYLLKTEAFGWTWDFSNHLQVYQVILSLPLPILLHHMVWACMLTQSQPDLICMSLEPALCVVPKKRSMHLSITSHDSRMSDFLILFTQDICGNSSTNWALWFRSGSVRPRIFTLAFLKCWRMSKNQLAYVVITTGGSQDLQHKSPK